MAQPSPTSKVDLFSTISQAPATIRVRNLRTILAVGTDAWGGPDKEQPVLISASVFLRQPFESASTQDAVTESTVNYGTLSKAILKSCSDIRSQMHAGDSGGNQEIGSLQHLLDYIRLDLVESGLVLPLMVIALEVNVMLPKGSLLGSGVSMAQTTVYDPEQSTAKALSMVLRLHDLRIPTLIGVHPNERLARQLVVANVEIDRWIAQEDSYCRLEQLVSKVCTSPPRGHSTKIPQTIEESSFQTLESLASHLAERIVTLFIFPAAHSTPVDVHNITISLEKPTAVTMADAPMVELTIRNSLEEIGLLVKPKSGTCCKG
ncbi:Dihydroneopterin aldolase-domain-containing protein [Amylocarpus encephaloides]|uniref:dihydroneopterin aldolase n=1 Tax=Amylocarpus encephaloides TaxID=45428 RepID=A0A9P7YRF0_9HELO|nr:Dihydroneopterin aldolase-domain-containing protein [Amylocarpus encephaloides]